MAKNNDIFGIFPNYRTFSVYFKLIYLGEKEAIDPIM